MATNEYFITDAPGGDFQVYQCPNCTKSYPTTNPDNQNSIQPLANCDRCGSPMAVGPAAQEFQDRRAEEAAAVSRSTPRQTVAV